jgi:hypothetical protein
MPLSRFLPNVLDIFKDEDATPPALLPGDDFAERALDLARRRKRLEQQQALLDEQQPTFDMVSGHVVPRLGNMVGQAVRALRVGSEEQELDRLSRELAAAQRQAQSQWLGSMPRATPAETRDVLAAQPWDRGDIEDAVPTRVVGQQTTRPTYTPSGSDMLAWAGKGAAINPALSGALVAKGVGEQFEQAFAIGKNKGVTAELREVERDYGGARLKGTQIYYKHPDGSVSEGAFYPLGTPQKSAFDQRLDHARRLIALRDPELARDANALEAAALALALNEISVVPDASGGATITRKADVAASSAPRAATTATTATTAPPAALGKVAPATQAERDRRRTEIIQREYIAERDRMPTDAKDAEVQKRNVAALEQELHARGVTPPGRGVYADVERYRGDARNRPYLPPEPIAGVRSTGPGKHTQALNTDVAKLSDDMTKAGIPDLRGAMREIDATVAKLAADPKSGLTVDPVTGKVTGAPGYGWYGVEAKLPPTNAAAREMRSAMQALTNIIAKARSGGAVTDNELSRLLNEMGQALGYDEETFWNAYARTRARLNVVEDAMTSGYAPIVVDAWRERQPAMRAAPRPPVPGAAPATTTPSPKLTPKEIGSRF